LQNILKNLDILRDFGLNEAQVKTISCRVERLLETVKREYQPKARFLSLEKRKIWWQEVDELVGRFDF
jgi:hypothetical protein